METLPALVEGGHVVVATAYYPPQVTGSSVIMQNLLSRFDPASYTVVTAQTPHRHKLERSAGGAEVVEIASSTRLSYRLNEWWREAQIPLMQKRVVSLVRKKDVGLIIGVYPDYHFLRAAIGAATQCGVPFVAYLHDTIVEALEGTALERKARALQDRVFSESARILVMSEGMSDLLRRKYALPSVPIVHTYPEPIPEELVEGQRLPQGFWGGSIYRINLNGVRRVSEGFGRLGLPFILATNRNRAELRQIGIDGDHLDLTFYARREAYLDALRRQAVVVQALDWPDESETHEDEMATIFPTKTPEYLAAGVPMLVHCPEHYFLARFVKEHGCGLVVGEREPAALDAALHRLVGDSEEVPAMRRAALRAAGMFRADRVAGSFSEEVEAAFRFASVAEG